MRTYTKVFTQIYEIASWFERNKYQQFLIIEITHRTPSDGGQRIELIYTTNFGELF